MSAGARFRSRNVRIAHSSLYNPAPAGLPAALAIGWGMYLIVMLPLTLHMWRREDADAATASNL